jgi:hypothetical protein
VLQERINKADWIHSILFLALGGAAAVAVLVVFWYFLPSLWHYRSGDVPTYRLFALVLSVIAGLGAIVLFFFATGMPPDGEKQQYIYVRHEASGEWGYFPPREHPNITFRNTTFSVIPFKYEWRTETQEVTVPGEGKATVTFSWRPLLDDLPAWIESDRRKPVEYVRQSCARYASEAFSDLAGRLDREQREGLLGKGIPLDRPEITKGRGLEMKNLTIIITKLPEPQPAPAPQEPWENYEELHIGDSEGKPVFLDYEDQIAHIQLIGASRFGKSKLVEYAMRQIIHGEAEGVCVIDPNQQLYDDLLNWCVHRGYDAIHFLDPSDEGSTVGFNPFRLEGKPTPDRISARANRLQATTLKALGMSGDGAVLAQRIIKCLYYVLIEQSLPVTDLNAFMVPRLFDRRDEIMSACQSEDIRDQWEMLTTGKGTTAYVNMMQSSANRLFDIIAERGVQRIFTNPKPIDLREITAKGGTLLVNLNKSDIFPLAARNVIGAFLVDEIWDIVSSRTREQADELPDFNFVIDEFHNFATPEFAYMLKEGGKYGLHLWLINHVLDDLDRNVRSSLNACHTRIAFGGTSQKDAAAVMEGSRPAQGNELRDEISWIPGLNKRTFMLRRTGKPNTFCTTPWVEDFPVTPREKQAFLDTVTRMPPAPVTVPKPDPKPAPSPPVNFEAILQRPAAVAGSPSEKRQDPPRKNAPKPEAAEPDDFYY